MIPVSTPAEMAAIDAAALQTTDELIRRAGRAVARSAVALMGGTYGRRVTVVAGPGNNGADGHVAAQELRRRGVRVHVVAPDIAAIDGADLVIDAAFGTGLSRPYEAPRVGATPVLAVDIPSGVDGLTGETLGRPLAAACTVTFAAAKPGLLLGAGAGLSGEIEVVDIGLDTSRLIAHLVVDADVHWWVPTRPDDAHKYRASTWVIAGSRGMTGAARLAAGAAQRAGAGYVRASTPGPGAGPEEPIEAVGHPLPVEYWDRDVLYALDKMGSIVLGPGLGRSDATRAAVRSVVSGATIPIVIDGDGLAALGDRAERFTRSRRAATIVTPHDGEFAALAGRAPGPDRMGDVAALAERLDAVVVSKGPTTVIAAPDGRVRFVTSGAKRLATAGTGDVLSGIVGAFVARRADPLEAAAAAAHVHGVAASLASPAMIASDLLDTLGPAMVRLDVV